MSRRHQPGPQAFRSRTGNTRVQPDSDSDSDDNLQSKRGTSIAAAKRGVNIGQENGEGSSFQWLTPANVIGHPRTSSHHDQNGLIALHGGSASTGFFNYWLMAHPTQSQYSMGAISACTGEDYFLGSTSCG